MTIKRFYLFLTFLVIAISGNPVMVILGKEAVYIGTLMIFMALWWFKPLKLTRQDLLVIGLFALIALTHVISFGSMVIAASLGFLIKLGIALLAVRLIPEFSCKYVSVMYVLACLSLFFYILVQLGIDLAGMLRPISIPITNTDVVHVGIHNFHVVAQRDRNCGMFWEPGAFAGYLILALFFLVRGRQNKAVLSSQGLVLIVTLLTTQSTTGYLAFLVLVMFYAYKVGWAKSMSSKWVVFPVLIVGFASIALVLFNQVSFLGEKINAQIESALVRDDTSRINRIGNFFYDIKWIADKPLLGWSATPETRLSIDVEVADLVAGQGNGLTSFAVRFGLSGLFIFIVFFAYTTRKLTGSLSAALFGIFVIVALLNGEQFLGFPMFLSLMFMPQNGSKFRLSVSPATTVPKHSFAARTTGYRA